jgi:hypothetical protein
LKRLWMLVVEAGVEVEAAAGGGEERFCYYY